MASARFEPIVRPGEHKGLRPANNTPAGKARLACVILRRLQRNFHHAQISRAMLARVNDDEQLRDLFKNTYEAHGLNVVYRAILDNLIIVLSRMFDPVFPGRKHGWDRASLPHLLHLLEDCDTRNQFLAAAWHWTPGMIEEKQMRTCEELMTKARCAYDDLSNGVLGKSVLAGLRWYRNANLAHTLFRGTKRQNLIYGEIGELLDQTSPIIQDLVLALRGQAWSGDGSDEAENRAEAFWVVVERGMRSHKRSIR